MKDAPSQPRLRWDIRHLDSRCEAFPSARAIHWGDLHTHTPSHTGAAGVEARRSLQQFSAGFLLSRAYNTAQPPNPRVVERLCSHPVLSRRQCLCSGLIPCFYSGCTPTQPAQSKRVGGCGGCGIAMQTRSHDVRGVGLSGCSRGAGRRRTPSLLGWCRVPGEVSVRIQTRTALTPESALGERNGGSMPTCGGDLVTSYGTRGAGRCACVHAIGLAHVASAAPSIRAAIARAAIPAAGGGFS